MRAVQALLLSLTHSNRLAALGGLLNLIITLQGQVSKIGMNPTLPPSATRCQWCSAERQAVERAGAPANEMYNAVHK